MLILSASFPGLGSSEVHLNLPSDMSCLQETGTHEPNFEVSFRVWCEGKSDMLYTSTGSMSVRISSISGSPVHTRLRVMKMQGLAMLLQV